jgi:hypothetical protein
VSNPNGVEGPCLCGRGECPECGAKTPKAMMRCPECGGTRLAISAGTMAEVDGTDMSAEATDIEWDNNSYAMCRSCGWDGIVAETYEAEEKEREYEDQREGL